MIPNHVVLIVLVAGVAVGVAFLIRASEAHAEEIAEIIPHEKKAELRIELTKTIVHGLGGVGVGVAVVLSWYQVSAVNEMRTEHESVEVLGTVMRCLVSEDPEVRLAGYSSLERLAERWPERYLGILRNVVEQKMAEGAGHDTPGAEPEPSALEAWMLNRLQETIRELDAAVVPPKATSMPNIP